MPFLMVKPGSGKSIFFLLDNWATSPPLSVLFPDLFLISKNPFCRLSDALNPVDVRYYMVPFGWYPSLECGRSRQFHGSHKFNPKHSTNKFVKDILNKICQQQAMEFAPSYRRNQDLECYLD